MNKALFSTGKDDWATPPALFNALDKEFGFTLDACANESNYKLKHYYSETSNGLIQDWSGEVVFCNPPYSRKGKQSEWIKKSYEESLKGATVVMLIPARTDTKAFHNLIFNKAAEIRFIRGRVKFEVDGQPQDAAPFPSMIVVFRGITNSTVVSTYEYKENK